MKNPTSFGSNCVNWQVRLEDICKIIEDCVEVDEEFSGGGDEDDFGGFACGAEALVEGFRKGLCRAAERAAR